MRLKTPADVFPKWLDKIGHDKVADKAGVTRQNVWEWYNRRSVPRPERAYIMIEMSAGALDWESIYMPFAVKRLRRI